MSNPNDYPARGKVKQVNGDTIVFQPAGTNYEIYLKNGQRAYSGPIDKPVQLVIHVTARKVWTVPSGGNFVAPIFGPPRIVQGRVRWLDEHRLVVQAGTNFLVELPASDNAYDLASGAIELGALVNVTTLPGATFKLLEAAPAAV